ncbi:oxygenase MpaB family protein [Nocardia xishanensis]
MLDTSNVLRRHLGDRRFALTLPRAVALQVLHPAIAAALREHAPNRLWEHKRRAVGGMINIAYSERDPRSGLAIPCRTEQHLLGGISEKT